MFSHLIGHADIKSILEKMVASQNIPSTLLFLGPSGVGKKLFAKTFAERLTTTSKEECPDIHYLVAEGKSDQHPILQIRELIQEANLPPFESPCKVFIIEEADKMLSYASNALLKVLEEPPPRTFFILTSSTPSNLLSTVLSRCCKLQFFPIPENEIAIFLVRTKGVTKEEARKRAILSEGSLGKALLSPCPIAIHTLFEAPDYATLLSTLSQIEEDLDLPEEETALRHEKIDSLFEEILFYIREKQPDRLEKTLKQVMQARKDLASNLKVKTVLEHFITQSCQAS